MLRYSDICLMVLFFFFFKQKTAYEMPSLVGSEMCIRDRVSAPAPAPATPVVKPTSKIEAVPISADACGICGQPLDGQASEFIGIRLGTIHRKCKHKPTKVRALTNHQYISPETHTLVKRVKGEVFELPAIEALELIRLG